MACLAQNNTNMFTVGLHARARHLYTFNSSTITDTRDSFALSLRLLRLNGKSSIIIKKQNPMPSVELIQVDIPVKGFSGGWVERKMEILLIFGLIVRKMYTAGFRTCTSYRGLHVRSTVVNMQLLLWFTCKSCSSEHVRFTVVNMYLLLWL